MKKPPDINVVVKCTLNKILNTNNTDVNILLDAIYRTNKIIINTYQFIRLYLLYQYKNNEQLIVLNKDVIKLVFNIVSINKNNDDTFKGEKLKLYNKFKDFYNNHYKQDKIDASNLSHVLSYCCTDIITNIENNIKLYFISYIKRFIKSSFKNEHNKLIDEAPKGQKTKLKKDLNNELIEVKNDIIDNTLLSNKKYHDWITKNRINILPINYKFNDHLDNPISYIKYMIYMCLEIEKVGKKSFQFMPIRTSFIPKYIPIDTSALVDLFLNKKNNNDLYNILTDKYKIKYKEYIYKKQLKDENEEDENKEDKNKEDENEEDKNKEDENEEDKNKEDENEEDKNKEDENEEEIKEIKFTKRKTQLNKSDILNNIIILQEEIWNYHFYMNHNIFKQSNYIFNYMLSTDGYSCSILMINKNKIEKKNKINENKKKERKKYKEICSEFTVEEKEEYKKNNDIQKKKNKIEKRNKLKEEYNKLTSKEKNAINTNKQKFIYLDDINNEQFKDLINKDWVVVDPGKKNLLSMMSNKGVYMKYTNKQHLFITKRLKYQSYIKHFKIKSNIYKIEEELSKYSTKTCSFDKYKETISIRNKLYDEFIDLYKNKIFRQYRWYGHINKKKAETKLIKAIKNKFGKDINILYGDWSKKKQMKNFISTPNIGLKRNIARNINLYNIDEYRTSKLNYKTEEETENLYLPDKKGVIRKIHSVLTYKTESGRSGCINRDLNAVKNMVKIVNYFIKYKDRPEKYKRTNKKSSQPTKVR